MKPTICTSSGGRHPLMAALQTNLYICIIDFIRKPLFVCSNDDVVLSESVSEALEWKMLSGGCIWSLAWLVSL